MAFRRMPRYGKSAAHDAPELELVQLDTTSATPLFGTLEGAELKTVCQFITTDADSTSAYELPRMLDESTTSDIN